MSGKCLTKAGEILIYDITLPSYAKTQNSMLSLIHIPKY